MTEEDITPLMKEAGCEVLAFRAGYFPVEKLVAMIYAAMDAVKPSLAERQLALIRRIDG